MLDPRTIAAFDQLMARMRHEVPAVLWSFYLGLWEQGFRPEQAMFLVAEFLKAMLVPAPGDDLAGQPPPAD